MTAGYLRRNLAGNVDHASSLARSVDGRRRGNRERVSVEEV